MEIEAFCMYDILYDNKKTVKALRRPGALSALDASRHLREKLSWMVSLVVLHGQGRILSADTAAAVLGRDTWSNPPT
jgi:hypothetical protein